jgi:hypothetical protein
MAELQKDAACCQLSAEFDFENRIKIGKVAIFFLVFNFFTLFQIGRLSTPKTL